MVNVREKETENQIESGVITKENEKMEKGIGNGDYSRQKHKQ